ncbi:hypothetical protein K449DRAFT_433230 [Hypoxylon sp. EC38]|nr:hypothetical protein K449DRAFT_433230 [Hypoxylon sp. EC38]
MHWAPYNRHGLHVAVDHLARTSSPRDGRVTHFGKPAPAGKSGPRVSLPSWLLGLGRRGPPAHITTFPPAEINEKEGVPGFHDPLGQLLSGVAKWRSGSRSELGWAVNRSRCRSKTFTVATTVYLRNLHFRYAPSIESIQPTTSLYYEAREAQVSVYRRLMPTVRQWWVVGPGFRLGHRPGMSLFAIIYNT